MVRPVFSKSPKRALSIGVGGYSLVELLLYLSIFVIGTVLLVGVLEGIIRIEERESAVTEVTGQTSFLMQSIKRSIQGASHIEGASSSLRLRTPNPSKDPTIIFVSGTTAYISESSSPSVALTNSKVVVDSLNFDLFSNPPGKDVVQIDFTLSYNTTNERKSFTKSLHSAVARVSAATFDSDLLPGTADTHDLGGASQKWQSGWFNGNLDVTGNLAIDTDTLYIDATLERIGIGVGTSPVSNLHVASSGYIQIPFRSSPTAGDCDSSTETGRLYFDTSANSLAVCDGTQWRYATTTP